jgi:hypothetical protein
MVDSKSPNKDENKENGAASKSSPSSKAIDSLSKNLEESAKIESTKAAADEAEPNAGYF